MIGSILLLQASQIAGRGLFLLFSLWYLNRFLGVEAKGQWSAVWSLYSIFAVFCNMGFEVWLTRAVASGQIGSVAARRALFRIKGPLWLVSLLIGGFWVIKGGFPVWLASTFFIALVFDSLALSTQAVFEGLGQFRSIAGMSFIKSGGFVLLSLPFALVIDHPPLELFGLLFAVMLAFRAWLGWHCWKELPKGNGILPAGALSQFFVMGALALVTVLYFQIDGVMLFQLKGDLESGNYGNAYHFLEGALFVNAAAASVLYPRLVKAPPERMAPLFAAALRLMLIAAVTLTLTLLTLGVMVGDWLVGPAFSGAKPPLSILAWGLPLMFGNGMLSRWLFAQGLEKFALVTASTAALLNIAGNFLLIPEYGPIGAAAMTLLTEGVLYLAWLTRLPGRLAILGATLLLYLAAAVTWWLIPHEWPLGVGLVISLAIFVFPLLYQARSVQNLAK